MAKDVSRVSMRVRIGDCELEVSGPQAFVEQKIEDFLANQKNIAPPGPRSPKQPAPKQAAPRTPPGKQVSVAQFFKLAAPKTDVSRTLVAGSYLEKYEGQESFTSTDIRETIKKAKIAPPKNPSETIAQNIRKGLMMSAGDKDGMLAFVLTSDGEDIVEETIGQS